MNGWHDLNDLIDMILGAIAMMVCIAALAAVALTLFWLVGQYAMWMWG